MDEYNAAIAPDPDNAWGYYFRGLSYIVQGRYEQAVAVWGQGAQEAVPACLKQRGLRYVIGAHGMLTPDIDEAVCLLQDVHRRRQS